MRNIFTRLWVVSLLLLVTATVSAQLTSLEVGKVYRFVSARTNDRSLSANGTNDVHTKTTDAADTKQEWYVTKEGEYYVLRNLACGKYLKGAPSAYTSWSMTDDYSNESNKFELYTSNTTLNTLKTKGSDGYGYMHDDNNGDNGGYNIVGWSNGDGSTGTHWTITKVDYTTDEIAALLEKAPTTAEAAALSAAAAASLKTLFTDGAGACVTPALGSLSAAQASEAYNALPATLKAMVDKVYNGTIEAWAEDNADDAKGDWSGEYAKKFRVQMYEPYSIAGDITGFLRMNAHANNDNPTGIYVPGGGAVYVMVEGEIKDGATLRLIDAGSNVRITDATTGGYELNTGLNIIRYTGDAGMLYVCYNVDTYDPDGATEADKFPHKLSEYPPLKIHIEGGAINGFYSSCGDYLAGKTYEGVTYNEDLWGGVDDDNDWIYMEERANLSVLPIISHRQILLFQLNEENGQQGMKHFLPESVSVPDTPFSYPQNGETSSWDDYDAYGMDCNTTTGKINIWMETWDRIMHAELATLGLISEDAVNIMNEFYPRWKSDGTKAEIYDMTNAGPDGNTYKVFCNGRDYCEYYNHHGVSLGTTTGYMSAGWNAANYNNSTFGELMGMPTSGGLWGPVHEIGHQFQDVFNIRGATEVTNNVFSNAATWYQGISTSRYNGGNLTTTLDNFNSGLPFVDYNIWSMTQLFYKLWLYYHLAGNNTQFYPRFFEMLRVDPLNAKGATATGTESMLKIYEKMCAAAGEDLTEFFRAHGFFVLLDNYAKGDYGTTIFTQTQEEVDAAIERVKSNGYKENFAVILINDGAEATLRHDGKTPRSFFDNTANPEYGGVNDFIDGSATTGGAYTATVNSDGTMTMIGEGGIGFLVFDENGKIISFNDNSTFALSDEAKEAILTGNATIVSVGSDINAEPVVAEIDLTAMQRTILAELIAMAQQIIDKIDDTYTKIGFYKGAAVADLAAALENAKTVYEGVSGYEAAYDLLYAEYQKVLANTDARIPFDPSLTYIITNKKNTNETMWVNNELVVRSEGGVDQTADAAKWQFKATASDGVYNIYNKKGYYCPAVTQSTAMTATTTANADALYTLQEMETGVWAIKLSPAAGYRNFHSSWSNVVGWEIGNDASRWYLTAVEPNATIADLTNLEVYITKTEALLGEVLGDVTYTTGENIDLQTTTEGSAGYIWSNAPHSEGPIANLVDGATNNYFHTDWQSGSDVTSGDHYIAVDLGAGNTLPRFAFSHTTRSGAQNDFPKSVDVYGSDDNVTYKYLGSASDMPQSAGAFWQFDGMIISSHRYLRFNMHANRGYWHMAEFDIMPVTSFTATVNDTYSTTVTVPTVTAAMEAMYNGKGVALSMSPEAGDIEAKLEALQNAYKALYDEYEATVNARKNTLAQLAANTQNLINQVGTVGFGSNVTKLTLTTENLYCNAPYTAQNNSDYSADYVSKLTDGKATTFLHTDYSGTIAAPHYLRVYLGENSTTKSFKFNYTTRDNGNNCPTTILIEGCNEADGTYTTITTLTAAANGLPNPGQNTSGGVAESFESSVITMGAAYKYVRFKVTGVEGGGATFFVMSEFGFSTVEDEIIVNAPYKSVVSEELLLASVHTTNSSAAMSTNALVTSVPMLDAQIADQQAAYNKLNEAMQKVTCDKTALVEYLVTANSLYEEFSEDGAIAPYYATSSVTLEQITALKEAIDASNAVVANDDAIQTDVDDALATLKAKAQVLEDIKANDYSGSRETIGTEITNAATLLAEVMSAAETLGDVPLQASDAAAPYYIWSNKPADDSNGIEGGLIDKNDDGTANTNTFFGTNWRNGNVEPYTHYLEVDLGSVKSIKELLFNYTTRASHDNQRPNGIKVLASNDKKNYKEVFSVTDGLPTGGTVKWELEEPLNFVGRYIRFAVSTEVGYFNMADFNLSIAETYALNEFYTTSDIDASLIAALNVAVQQASEAKDCFVLEDDYNTALANLQNAYNTLNGFKNAHVTDVSDLGELATTTDVLVTEVATFTEEENEITMQCDDENGAYYLYCNADGTATNGSGDNVGVAALVGDNATNDTHLHTTYGGNAQDDDLDHYLRLDMGEKEAMVSFKFRYRGRVNNNNNAPKTMVIEGSNDLNNFEEIATLTNLPVDDATVTYTTPTALGNGKAYRYIRFMVTATNNGAANNGHPFFVLSQFAVTACKTIKVSDDYVSPNLPLTTLVTANNEMVEANAIVAGTEHYLTETAYNAAIDELQAAYDALNAATVADKTELNNLIEATRILKNGLYETVITSYTANEITLSATEGDAGWLYCNAAESNSTWATDNAGVAAAIDLTDGGEPNLDTFLHTEYGNDQSADGLDHYLRVDLGADGATDYIEFGYYGRSGHLAKSPKKVIVAATNDLTDGGVWTEIATLNLAQASASTETKTGCLGNGVEYRYWRFLVEETHGGGKDRNNHQFFCMTEFNVYKCTGIVKDEQLKYSPTIYIYTTTELVTEVENAIITATGVSEDENAKPAGIETAVDALQAVYDKLEEALKYAGLPVTITTDEANPVLYKIISKRADDGSKVLQFDEPTTNKVAIVATADNASYQAWYFMKGENGYLIKPFNGDGKMLGVSSTGDASASASIAETATYKEWDFSRSTVNGCTDYFYIYVNGTSHACLSHNGGFNTTDKLGIWAGGWNTNDGGTLFKFVEAEFENDNARYYQLSDFENTLEYQTATTPEGTTVGTFTNGNAYNTAYTTASTLIEAGNTSDAAACKDAYTALRAADADLEQNLPEEGKIYRIDITPTLDDANRAGASMRIDDNGKLACGVFDAANARFYFTFEYDNEGKLYMKNLHSATFVDEALAHNSETQVGADAEEIANAKSVNITTLGSTDDGKALVGITPTGGAMLNCAAKEGNVVAFNNTGTTKASAWVINEVEIQEVEENVKHTISLAPNTTGDDLTTGYSTLNLGYPVTVPAGVKAYIVTNSAIVDKTIELYEYASEGATIPANFPVILRGSTETAATREFQFKNSSVAAVDNVTNLLGGTNYTTYESCLNENGENVYNIYMLTRSGGIVAMRWAYENYDADRNYTGKNDDGGYVKCTANKVYLKLGGTSAANLSATYYFSLFSGTTDIDKIESEENPLDGTIYDLQGRKIDEVKTPGFYIVNGKKMYVNSEMLK